MLCHAMHAVPPQAKDCCMLCMLCLTEQLFEHAMPKAIPGERIHQQPASAVHRNCAAFVDDTEISYDVTNMKEQCVSAEKLCSVLSG